MDYNTLINAFLLLVTAVAAICALRQYIDQKDSQEQAREICIYLICLYDTTDNKWSKLKIGSQGDPNKTKSMAFGVMIENNSKQPIRDLVVEINQDALDKYKDQGMIVSKSIGNTKKGQIPIKMIPPGKWVISVDETLDPKHGDKLIEQGMNLLDDLILFEHAAYVPVVRTDKDGIERYYFRDHMGFQWKFSSGDNCRLRKSRGVINRKT